MRVATWKVLAAAGLMVLGISFQAEALPITPADAIEEGNETDVPSILAYLESLGYDVSTELYKSEADSGDEGGSFASSYDTSYDPYDDPDSALIQHVGGPSIAGSPIYLLVKDGNQSPAWYFFNLSSLGWDGTDALELSEFWPTQGAISYVAMYGTTASVPDGGSMAMLLGLALLGLAGTRRMLS